MTAEDYIKMLLRTRYWLKRLRSSNFIQNMKNSPPSIRCYSTSVELLKLLPSKWYIEPLDLSIDRRTIYWFKKLIDSSYQEFIHKNTLKFHIKFVNRDGLTLEEINPVDLIIPKDQQVYINYYPCRTIEEAYYETPNTFEYNENLFEYLGFSQTLPYTTNYKKTIIGPRKTHYSQVFPSLEWISVKWEEFYSRDMYFFNTVCHSKPSKKGEDIVYLEGCLFLSQDVKFSRCQPRDRYIHSFLTPKCTAYPIVCLICNSFTKNGIINLKRETVIVYTRTDKNAYRYKKSCLVATIKEWEISSSDMADWVTTLDLKLFKKKFIKFYVDKTDEFEILLKQIEKLHKKIHIVKPERHGKRIVIDFDKLGIPRGYLVKLTLRKCSCQGKPNRFYNKRDIIFKGVVGVEYHEWKEESKRALLYGCFSENSSLYVIPPEVIRIIVSFL